METNQASEPTGLGLRFDTYAARFEIRVVESRIDESVAFGVYSSRIEQIVAESATMAEISARVAQAGDLELEVLEVRAVVHGSLPAGVGYVLRSSITGLFYDGTNFSADREHAREFDTRPDLFGVQLTWGKGVEIVEEVAR